MHCAPFIDRKALSALTFRFPRCSARAALLTPRPLMSKPVKTPTFESSLAELEEIVAEMEAGQLPLEKSLAAYKRGAELLKFCQGALQDAQQQVKILEDGVLKNFSPSGQ
jgi:exodeoxyribonuclease VII small subunit